MVVVLKKAELCVSQLVYRLMCRLMCLRMCRLVLLIVAGVPVAVDCLKIVGVESDWGWGIEGGINSGMEVGMFGLRWLSDISSTVCGLQYGYTSHKEQDSYIDLECELWGSRVDSEERGV